MNFCATCRILAPCPRFSLKSTTVQARPFLSLKLHSGARQIALPGAKRISLLNEISRPSATASFQWYQDEGPTLLVSDFVFLMGTDGEGLQIYE